MPIQRPMMQRWSAETIRYMCNASSYGSYHKDLARFLLPHIPKEGHVCDAGCGLGYLSLELAKHCREVTAVDASPAALSMLLSSVLPANLHVRQGDILTMEGDYDAMIFCYFGKTEEILRVAAAQCKGAVMVVRRNCGEHRFSLGPVARKPHSIDQLCSRLEELFVPYEVIPLSLELGQPFTSMEDALDFFRLYNKADCPVTEADVAPRLRTIEDPRYPLYYPNRRDMECICFAASDLKGKKI